MSNEKSGMHSLPIAKSKTAQAHKAGIKPLINTFK
jgi:hypothetical protein